MLRSSYSLNLPLAHDHSAFSADGSGEPKYSLIIIGKFMENGICHVASVLTSVLTDLVFVFHVGDMKST